MMAAWCAGLALAVLTPGVRADGSTSRSGAVAYTHATLIDGTGSGPRKDMTVLVDSGRIAGVFPAAGPGVPVGATVVDLAGRYVIPGLIDAHVHVATDPSGRDARARDQLRAALLGGVTAVRDMAGDGVVLAELAREADAPESGMPRVYFAALVAGPSFFEDPRVRASTHGRTPGEAPWQRAVTPTTDIRAAVAEAKQTGATGIKIYADLPPSLLAAIAGEAHRQELKVWSHATVFPARPQDALQAGVDVLSHAILLYWQGATDIPLRYHNRPPTAVYESFDVGGRLVEELLRGMRERGTVLDATLSISSRLEAARPGTAGMADPRRAVQWMYDVTKRARELGVIVAAGTDGMLSGPGEIPTIHREMELLVSRAGFTPLEAITAATLHSARAIGAEDVLGTVAPGKRADFVVLTADPIADIRNTQRIALVVKGGRPFRREVDARAALAGIFARWLPW